MKKVYVSPVFETVKFDSEEIILLSGNSPEPENKDDVEP